MLKCHTPRRNKDVIAAIAFFEAAQRFANSVCSYFTTSIFPRQQNENEKSRLDVGAVNAGDVFVPVLPLFEEDGAEKAQSGEAKRKVKGSKKKKKSAAAAASASAAGSGADGDGDTPSAAAAAAAAAAVVVPRFSSAALVVYEGGASRVLLPLADINAFLAYESTTLQSKFSALAKTFPANDGKVN